MKHNRKHNLTAIVLIIIMGVSLGLYYWIFANDFEPRVKGFLIVLNTYVLSFVAVMLHEIYKNNSI